MVPYSLQTGTGITSSDMSLLPFKTTVSDMTIMICVYAVVGDLDVPLDHFRGTTFARDAMKSDTTSMGHVVTSRTPPPNMSSSKGAFKWSRVGALARDGTYPR